MARSMKFWAITIFMAATLMRFAALASWEKEKSLYYVSDSYTYVQIAKNLLEHSVYSMELSETPHPDNFRTPLYPLFLLPFVYFKTSMYLPVIIQTILMGIALAWIYTLATRLFGEKIARYATLFFALEPFTALISSMLMTEAIFISLFVPAFLFLALYLKEDAEKNLYIGAVLLAISALTRPVAFYLFILIPILPYLKGSWKKHWRSSVSALAIFFVLVAPWLYFTRFIVKTNDFSSLSSFDMYAYHGVYFDAWRATRGADDRLPTLDLKLINDTLDARPIPQFKAVGLNYIKAHFPEYMLYHALRLPRLFTDSGYASILNGISALNFSFDSVNGGFVEQIELSRLRQTFIKPLIAEPAFLILLIADLLFIAITILALLNPLIAFYRKRELNMQNLLIILFILAYAVLASPIGGARFRIPINIFLFLLAFDSLRYLKKNEKTDTLLCVD